MTSDGTRVRAALGAARFLDCDLVIDLPDRHPSAHAAMQIDLTLDGERIAHVDPRIGLMHRSVEKLFEARDYRQVLMLASRHDWLGSFSGEHGAALVIEEALGITPPERARWSRTLLAELTRVSAALAFLAIIESPVTDGPGEASLRIREACVQHLELATGNRVHPMITRIGGLGLPLTPEWLEATTPLMEQVRTHLAEVGRSLDSPRRGLVGLAPLAHQTALSLGASGPVGRASGVELDARRIRPYDAYPECQDLLARAPSHEGDARARYAALSDDALAAVAIVDRCVATLAKLGEGPIDVPLPKVIRVPEGQTYRLVETPLGITGFWLVSAGDRAPWRLKLRTPSFSHVQAMADALRGTPLTDLTAAVASFFLVVGDIDR